MTIKYSDHEVRNVKLIRIDSGSYGRIVILKGHSKIILNGTLNSYDIGEDTIISGVEGTFIFQENVLTVIS